MLFQLSFFSWEVAFFNGLIYEGLTAWIRIRTLLANPDPGRLPYAVLNPEHSNVVGKLPGTVFHRREPSY